MLGERNHIIFTLLSVFTLILVLGTQVLPNSNYFTIEFSESINMEDIDSEEKDSEEESESKYTQKSSDLVARETPFGAIIFNSLNKTHTSPALETFSPPPDWL